ncbi:MAG: bifunctional riboflavin kinase/FAD synthetase [Thermodesulfobacteriota bacterium]
MKVLKNGRGARAIKSCVLTLGNFDGLHLGHGRIIKKVVKRAEALGCPSVVYTFEPHPLKVVSPHKSPPLLLDLEDKIRLIEGFGVDYLVLARFTREFAERHPAEFVEEVLVKTLSVSEVWVGHDFSFGRGRTGTVELLKSLGGAFGFSASAIPAFVKLGGVVSSSRIRALVKEGGVKEAAALLGRGYSIKGKVVKGENLGREIGFPTANLRTTSELLPADGVYAAYATFSGQRRGAVVNIGTAPTFGGRERCVEVHIFGFEGSIYGRKMEVSFVRRLRSETAFGSKEALVRQIEKDSKRARRILKL